MIHLFSLPLRRRQRKMLMPFGQGPIDLNNLREALGLSLFFSPCPVECGAYSSNTVCFSTSVCRARSAFFTKLRRSSLSSSSGNAGLPKGWGIATAGTMRLAPTVKEMGTIEATCTTGNPTRSISFANVAPQRVSVPQVEVRITPSTSAAFNFSAITLPNL